MSGVLFFLSGGFLPASVMQELTLAVHIGLLLLWIGYIIAVGFAVTREMSPHWHMRGLTSPLKNLINLRRLQPRA